MGPHSFVKRLSRRGGESGRNHCDGCEEIRPLARRSLFAKMPVPVLLAAPVMIFLEAKSSRLRICKLFSFISWSDELRFLESTVIRRESESKFRSPRCLSIFKSPIDTFFAENFAQLCVWRCP